MKYVEYRHLVHIHITCKYLEICRISHFTQMFAGLGVGIDFKNERKHFSFNKIKTLLLKKRLKIDKLEKQKKKRQYRI